MNYNLLYAVLFGITSFGFLKLHQWWLKDRIKNGENKSFTYAGIFKHWFIIIGLAIASIVNFFKAIN